ncbi:uncharacterized protein [Macrobrachium rosenbergii]|uniref:uncharacterized protein n=1 Tax=Macrobrachium rosenbergii TaxID=79674 RepID=UPI0034D7A740
MFNVEKFLSTPKTELLTLRYAKKQELLIIAKHWNITVDPSHVKARLINDILQFLIQKKAVDEGDEDVEDLRSLTGAIATPSVDPEMEKLKLQMQVLQLQRQTEAEKIKAEARSLELHHQAEEAKLALELEHQRQLNELEIERETKRASILLKTKQDEKQIPDPFDLIKATKLVPEFNERDPEVFFKTFEDTAATLNWPKDKWVLLIRNHLKGKASFVASQLLTNKDYDSIKKAILDAYAITVEGYRQNFRNSFKSASQTFVEFCELKIRQLNKWLSKAEVQDFDSFKNLIVLEELIRKLPLNIATHIMDKGETNALKAASIADDFALIHKYKPSQSKSVSSHKSYKYSSQVCSYCKKEGHDIQHCPLPQCKRSDSVKSATSKPEQPSSRTNQSHQKTLHVAIPKQEEDPFKAFTCAGSLNGIPVECLRDTGSTQTIVSVTKDLPLELTNEYITVTDLTTSTTLPLAKVRLCCPYFDGDTVVAVTDKQLPHSSVQVILGNDLAGSKVLDTNLIITDPQIIFNKENTDKQPTNEAEIVQVATRSAREDEKANLDKQNRTTAALDIIDIHKDDFKYHQRADPSLAVCWKKVSDINDLSKTPCFYQDKDFLFRLFRPSKSPSTHTWLDQHQLVVPSVFRKSLLDLAHSTESHLGIHKTFDRLAENFFWPGMKKDVKDFVQQCHHCQVTDASGTGFGGVLMQQHQSSLATPPPPLHHLMPIAYYSGYFKGAQTRWATIEKELYAIIAALLHFKPYLEGNQHVIIYTDHNPLIFLDRAKLKNNKLLRWSYILSEFNIKLQAIRGPQNILADTLSRIPQTTS